MPVAALRDSSNGSLKGLDAVDQQTDHSEDSVYKVRKRTVHREESEQAALSFRSVGPEDAENPFQQGGDNATTSSTTLPSTAPAQGEDGAALYVKQLKQDQEEIGFGISVFFYSTLAWDMFLLWMLLSPDPQVRSYSVKTISSCMAIFMALSIEHAELGLVVNGFHMKKLCTVLFLLHWVLIPVITWPLRGSHVNFAAAVHILAHVTAFLGICACNQFFSIVRAATSGFSPVVVIGIQFLLLLKLAIAARVVVLLTSKFLRRQINVPDEPHAQHVEAHHSSLTEAEYLEEVEEANIEAACILVSYLAKNWIVSSLLLWCQFDYGKLSEGDVVNMKQSEGFLLFITYLSAATLAIYGILAILQGAAPYILQNHGYKHYLTLLNFTTAWTSAALIKWLVCFFLVEETCIRVTGAVFCTILGCLLLIVVDKLADFSLIGEPEAEALARALGTPGTKGPAFGRFWTYAVVLRFALCRVKRHVL
ncbi:styx-b [Symbiodinium sp. CCMP2456]|nr:styx-b [Symbiodinium sp. CCMP2456]